MTPTDYDIINWIESNIDKIQVNVKNDYDSYTNPMKPLTKTYQREIRKGIAGQRIMSEKEYYSLREMAEDALK